MHDSISSIFTRTLAAGVLAVMLVAVLCAAQWFVRDLQFTTAATEVSFWGRDKYKPPQATVSHTTSQIEQLLLARPANPNYLALLANSLAWRAYWTSDPERREQVMRDAIAAQFLVAEYRPAHRQSWSKLVDYSSRAYGSSKVEALALQRFDALQRWVEPPHVQ